MDQDGSGDCDEVLEVQSSFNGDLDSMESLQQVLPMRRGISGFYKGRYNSFTSLAELQNPKPPEEKPVGKPCMGEEEVKKTHQLKQNYIGFSS
ncbi:hypothetical protein V6N13_002419 [Hibiscus sabdariffa]|uniref:Uncharacterized protein n=1 Tax=Hibiscus sabdariffa TaxID=183260 RepID=A0ABR2C2S4_9ROSI